MNILPIETINQETFLPFGDIIEKTNSNKKLTINQGTTIRHSEISKLNLNTNNGDSYISIFSGEPRKFPIEIKILEKHPLATQTFLPIQNFDWLVVVAQEENNMPNLNTLRCFKVNSETGVTYKTNTWHHPLLVTKNQDFWVIDRINNFEKNNENLEEFYFDEKDYVYIDLNV